MSKAAVDPGCFSSNVSSMLFLDSSTHLPVPLAQANQMWLVTLMYLPVKELHL